MVIYTYIYLYVRKQFLMVTLFYDTFISDCSIGFASTQSLKQFLDRSPVESKLCQIFFSGDSEKNLPQLRGCLLNNPFRIPGYFTCILQFVCGLGLCFVVVVVVLFSFVSFIQLYLCFFFVAITMVYDFRLIKFRVLLSSVLQLQIPLRGNLRLGPC